MILGARSSMKNRIIISLMAALVLGMFLTGGWSKSQSTLEYRFVSVSRGDVERVVEATGTLQATTTVQVGAQVSGQIDRISVDFNDHVVAGQVIARINPTVLQTEVSKAEADLTSCLAEQDHRLTENQRMASLHAEALVSDTELDISEYKLDIAKAAVLEAQVGLERAQLNLAFTEITAPVDGVVLDRNVDVGQTVASNFSSPLLFLIAEDLTRMEILVSVDESDIGLINKGQKTRFTVQANPDYSYNGTVLQIRLQSTWQENVVNYTVVVEVDNKFGKLLPGMTATVDFLIDSAHDVLLVPNAALRFRPNEEMIGMLNDQGKGKNKSSSEKNSQDMSPLFIVDENGEPSVILVQTGMSDGSVTHIINPDLLPGHQIVAGIVGGTTQKKNNPFQNSNTTNQGPRRGPQG